MKLSTGINILGSKNLDKKISKKILLANTSSRKIDPKAIDKSVGTSNDPEYIRDQSQLFFNPDIRYRNYYAFSPLANIEYRNALIMFAENKELKKAVRILSNEMVVQEEKGTNYKYSVYPEINLTKIESDKQNVGKAMSDYISEVFYPRMWQMYNFKKDGLLEKIREFLITGKICYEIVYDNLQHPKEIIGLVPLDPGTIQKVKEGDYIYYIQKATFDTKERVLHENQVILCEWNKYDYGYVSYIDGLRMSYNIMRSMQTSKILWFATKSQVRMHIKLALGDISREEAKQKLSEARNNYTNKFSFSEDGTVLFNNTPNNSGYREFFTAETAASGSPEIEEVNSNGPDLTETESLSYWERLYWNDTEIPYDRIDPSSSDSWGFLDVEALKKTEIVFSKFVSSIRDMLEDLFMKPIIIQLTLKEVEIGIDLSLLDSIEIKWVSYNQYEKMADLSVLEKKVGIASSIKDFGMLTNAAGNEIPMFPTSWLMRNILEYDEETMKLIEEERAREFDKLGYEPDGKPKKEFVDAQMGSMGDMDMGMGEMTPPPDVSLDDEDKDTSSEDEDEDLKDEDVYGDDSDDEEEEESEEDIANKEDKDY